MDDLPERPVRHHMSARGTACGLTGDAATFIDVTTTCNPEARARLVTCPECRAALGLDVPLD